MLAAELADTLSRLLQGKPTVSAMAAAAAYIISIAEARRETILDRVDDYRKFSS